MSFVHTVHSAGEETQSSGKDLVATAGGAMVALAGALLEARERAWIASRRNRGDEEAITAQFDSGAHVPAAAGTPVVPLPAGSMGAWAALPSGSFSLRSLLMRVLAAAAGRHAALGSEVQRLIARASRM